MLLLPWTVILGSLLRADAAGSVDRCLRRHGLRLTGNTTEAGARRDCSDLGLDIFSVDPASRTGTINRHFLERLRLRCGLKDQQVWVVADLDSVKYYAEGVVWDAPNDPRAARRALCWRATIGTVEGAPALRTEIATETQTQTETYTRKFDLDLTATSYIVDPTVQAGLPEESAVLVITVTDTEYVTSTFSIPTVVKFGSLAFTTVTERRLMVVKEHTGTTTEYEKERVTLTVTTSVLAWTNVRATETVTLSCTRTVPDAFVAVSYGDGQAASVVDGPTAVAGAVATRKERLCGLFSGPGEIRVCEEVSPDGLVLVLNPVDFMTAPCVCDALGLKLANLVAPGAYSRARQVLERCTEREGAWAGRVALAAPGPQVCMALNKGSDRGGPVPCIETLPVVCQ